MTEAPRGCVFCAILSGELPATFVYENDATVGFMDIRPVRPGHTLVLPRVHAALLQQLDAAVMARVWSTVHRLVPAVRAATDAEGLNLYVADGEAAGQEVPHAHVHLIPRHRGDGFGLRFPPGYGATPERSELESVAARIRQAVS